MLMEHLLFNRHRPEEQPLLIDHGLLASFNDESYEHFSSGPFLESFQRDVLPEFEWSEYDYAQGLAREVERVWLPSWLEDALVEELATPPNEAGSLYFATGRKYNPSADRGCLNREAHAEAVKLTADKILVADQELLLDYHHALPPNSFTRLIQDGLYGALAAVKNIKNAAARAQTSAVLRRLQGASVPYYTAVHNSYRLYQPVAGLQQLKREVRASLMRGCVDLDADALHIAIMAKQWGVQELQALLQDHGAKGFWRELTTFMAGRPLRDVEQKAWKGVLKHGVYALGYGGGEAKIAEQIQAYDETCVVGSHFGSYEKVVARMKAMPQMDALFKAKDYWVKRISEEGGMRGAYEWVPLRKTRRGQPGRNPLTVLAMVSSSYELSLMASIYPVAKQYADDVKILLYQFDGVTLKFRTSKERQRQNILAQMHAAFDARAEELGIITGLKSEWL